MKRILVLLAAALVLATLYSLLSGSIPDFAGLKAGIDGLRADVAASPVQAGLVFFLAYVLVAALSIPAGAVMTLAAGALFGFWAGLLLVSFAASLGATLAFLLARTLLHDWVQHRFGLRLAPINEGLRRDGPLYLFTLRLIPVFPFFVVNLAMGLTPIPVRTFYWVSQLGMLPATAVYVNAGTQIAAIADPSDVLSPGLIASFLLIGIFPWIARAAITAWERRKIYARFQRPRSFDRNLIVIGAGAAGLVTTYIARAVKAKVTLIEAHKMGGDCLNYGCVPSKALIRSAKLARQIRHADQYGLTPGAPGFSFRAVMQRIHAVIATIAPNDSIERYESLGAEVLKGYAKIRDPWTVEVALVEGGTRILTTRAIVIATGARPFVPPLPGIDAVGYLTSDTLWEHLSTLDEVPQRMVILGGGPIGCELAQSFARLGSAVTQIEMADRLLSREDPEVSELAREVMTADGVTVLTGHRAISCEMDGAQKIILVEAQGITHRIAFDELICAVGRVPRLTGFGLEELGIPTGRTVETNSHLETIYPNILAAGDVAGPYQFTHTASLQAWFAAVNALFGNLKRFKADYRVIPWTTFLDPEVARVGLNEQEAREKGIAYELAYYDLHDLDRAIADGATKGFVKVLTVPGRDTILGVTIVGEHAGDLLAEFVLAMKHGLGLNKILGTIHTYPTMAEANKYVAGQWRRAHVSKHLEVWLERYHSFMRGGTS